MNTRLTVLLAAAVLALSACQNETPAAQDEVDQVGCAARFRGRRECSRMFTLSTAFAGAELAEEEERG